MNRFWTVVVIGLAVMGCKRSIKSADVEAFMKQRTSELGIAATKVTCPKHIDAKVGNKFECTLEIETKPYTIVATITKVEDGKAIYDTAWKNSVAGVVFRNKLVPAMSKELTAKLGAPVTIACAEPLLFLDAAHSVTCDLTAGATKAKINIKFDDKLSPTSWKMDPPLLAKVSLEKILTAPVRAKTSPGVAITCGTEALIARPADGIVWCAVDEGAQHAKLKVQVDDKLAVQNWEVVPN